MHDRMPVILTEQAKKSGWITARRTYGVSKLLKPYDAECMENNQIEYLGLTMDLAASHAIRI